MSRKNSNIFSRVSETLNKVRNKSEDEPVSPTKKSAPRASNRKNTPVAKARPKSAPKNFRLTEEQIMEYKEAFAAGDAKNIDTVSTVRHVFFASLLFLTIIILTDNDKKYHYVKVFDKDDDELLSIPETLKVMHALGKHITMTQLKGALQPYTTKVDFPEFLTLVAQEVRDDSEEGMKESIAGIFDWFDHEKRGYITSAQLRHVLMHLGEKLTNDEVNKLLEEVDPDRKGKIKLEPLCLYIMSK